MIFIELKYDQCKHRARLVFIDLYTAKCVIIFGSVIHGNKKKVLKSAEKFHNKIPVIPCAAAVPFGNIL